MQGVVGLSVHELVRPVELRCRVDRNDDWPPFQPFRAVDCDDLDGMLGETKALLSRACPTVVHLGREITTSGQPQPSPAPCGSGGRDCATVSPRMGGAHEGSNNRGKLS